MGEKMEKRQKDFCMGCMNPLDGDRHCICGFSIDGYKVSTRCLPPGTVLTERYLVGRMIGEGSFGVTYIGRDLLLGIIVAIKEYFPLSYGSRDARKGEQVIYIYQDNDKKGLEHFYREAKLLSQFHMLDGIVSVRDFFYANETAYIVMDYIKGITLKEHVKKNGAVEGKEALAMIRPVIRSLHIVHQADIIHRDISPDNLLLTEQKKLVLVDFGSARVEDSTMTQSMTVMFKRGYTPKEQYLRRGKLGAWSDIYSLCATMYFMLTGVVPNEAIERMLQDTIVPLPKMSSVSLAQKQKNAIMKGICVKPEERWQSMLELYDALYYKKEENALDIKWFRKKQLKAALLLIFILLLCIGAGWKVKNRLFLCMAEMQLGLWLSQQP
jgi:Serine/threonine protein kinase